MDDNLDLDLIMNFGVIKIAAVTVLYKPGIELIENIKSYLNQIEILYIINNSEEELCESLKAFLSDSKIKIFNNHKNLGIAAALNYGIKQAQVDGFEFVLTMDQDSKVSDNAVSTMMQEFENNQQVGIVAPFVVHAANPQKPLAIRKKEIQIAMTSGSIIRLSAFSEVGGFLSKLFIDYVDYEFSLRLIKNGFKIIQIQNVYVFHKLGNIKVKNFLYRKIYPTNHAPTRLYYRTRNRFYVYKLYSNMFREFIINDKKLFLKELVKIICFEDNKFKKLYFISLGYLHFKRNKFDNIDI
jgi:rhamnosyltransferase